MPRWTHAWKGALLCLLGPALLVTAAAQPEPDPRLGDVTVDPPWAQVRGEVLVTVTAHNSGADSAKGDIELGFPAMRLATTPFLAVTTDTPADIYESKVGESPPGCAYGSRRCAPYAYPSIIASFHPWPSGATHTLTVRMQPPEHGPFLIESKITMVDSRGDWTLADPTTGPLNQQAEAVRWTVLPVRSPLLGLPEPVFEPVEGVLDEGLVVEIGTLPGGGEARLEYAGGAEACAVGGFVAAGNLPDPPLAGAGAGATAFVEPYLEAPCASTVRVEMTAPTGQEGPQSIHAFDGSGWVDLSAMEAGSSLPQADAAPIRVLDAGYDEATRTAWAVVDRAAPFALASRMGLPEGVGAAAPGPALALLLLGGLAAGMRTPIAGRGSP